MTESVEKSGYKFELLKLVFADGIWKMSIGISAALKNVFRGYMLNMFLDEREFKERIEKLEKEIARLRTNPTLLPDEDKLILKDLEEQKQAITNQLNELREICQPINVEKAYVAECKNGAGTKLVLMVPFQTINELNNVKDSLSEYVIALTPIE